MKNKILFPLVFIGALVARILIIIFTDRSHLIQISGDDFYIYLQILRNWIQHGIISFDGSTWTSGFHPIYTLVFYPILKLFGSVFPYDKLVLVFLAAIDMFTSIFIYKIVRFYYSEKIALLTACFWILNPGAIFIWLIGTEAAILGFVFSAFIYFYLKFKKQEKFSLPQLVLVSCLYGLLFLTRTEMILLSIPLAIDLIIHLKGKRKFSAKKTIFLLVLSLVISVIISLPWFLYCYFATGSFLQDSGKSLVFLTHQDFNKNPSVLAFIFKFGVFSTKYLLKLFNSLGNLSLFAVMLALIVSNFLKIKFKPGRKTKIALFILLLLSVAISALIPESVGRLSQDLPKVVLLLTLSVISFLTSLILSSGYRRKDGKDIFKDTRFLLFFVAIHFIFYTAYFWLVQPWYLYSVLLVLTLMLVPNLFAYALRYKNKILVAIIFIILIARIVLTYYFPYLPWQINFLDSAGWIKSNTPQNTVIGSMDAGIIAFFSDRKTVNLDGIVNTNAYDALKKGQLFEYIDTENITFLLGNKIQDPKFEIVKVFNEPGSGDIEQIWKRTS